MNQQQPLMLDRQEDGSVLVHSIFSSIQGEGPFVGRPAIFIRLAGCNLQCSWCDTSYTGTCMRYTPRQLMLAVSQHNDRPTNPPLIVLTGGEPFRQNIGPLVDMLLDCRLQVQIETNGTLYLENLSYSCITIVCSPKLTINPSLEPYVSAWKYIVAAGEVDERDGLPRYEWDNDCPHGPHICRPYEGHPAEIFVQPRDDGDPKKNAANLQTAVHSCMKFGYRLCLQIHKIIGVD